VLIDALIMSLVGSTAQADPFIAKLLNIFETVTKERITQVCSQVCVVC